MLAHQERIESRGCKLSYIPARMNSALANPYDRSGNLLGQPELRFERDLEGVQIAIVHADDVRAGCNRGGKFVVIMHFYQSRHTEARRHLAETPHSGFVEH